MSSSHPRFAAATASGVAASNLIDANSANLDVARALAELSRTVDSEDVKKKLLEQANRIVDNSELINSTLHKIQIKAKS